MQPHSDMCAYFAALADLGSATKATDAHGRALDLDIAMDRSIAMVAAVKERGNKLMVIGNGGSAAIASHVAVDYSKNGGVPTQDFNNGALLTCLGNDFGFDNVFAKAVELYGRAGDLLIAISSSGRSPNILKGVDAARAGGCSIMTLSGFDSDNPLRSRGDINLYVASHRYGYVEILHLALCHALLDTAMGLECGHGR